MRSAVDLAEAFARHKPAPPTHFLVPAWWLAARTPEELAELERAYGLPFKAYER